MMNEVMPLEASVIVSLISILGSALGTFAGILVNSKLVNYRIEQLEKKVDKHNNVIERVYQLETNEAVVDEEIKEVKRRVGGLENYHK